MPARLARALPWAAAAALLGLVITTAVWSRHWRLVNDAAQIDYVVFLISKGFVPYGQIVEMNMPGIYMVNATVMHLLGEGALAWRMFDCGLLAAMIAGMATVVRKQRIAGVLAGLLFVVDHWADGSENLGQRDLIIAVLLMWSYACLFSALRRGRWQPALGMGLCLGLAATVKPTPLPFALLLLALFAQRWRALGLGKFARPLLATCAGIALPLLLAAGYVAAHHAVHPFLYVLRVQLPFYALQMRSGYAGLLLQAISPRESLLVVVAGMVALARARSLRNWENGMLLLGVFFGLGSMLAQHKGMIYHRYPLHAFLLLWAAVELVEALRDTTAGPALRWVSALAVVWMAFMGLHFAKIAHRRIWPENFDRGVTADLQKLGGNALSGKVQCLATYAECDTTLFRLKLAQSTGLIYDFFLFGPGDAPAVQDARRTFLAEIKAAPPKVLIMQRGKFGTTLDEYARPDVWPDFAAFLAAHYRIFDEQNFRRDELNREQGFRIYVLEP